MAEYLISISLLICAVLLIRGIFRRTISPRAVYALWLVVVIRMCLPIALFEVEAELPDFLQHDRTEQSEIQENQPESTETSADTTVQTAPTGSVQNPAASVLPVPSVTASATPITPSTPEAEAPNKPIVSEPIPEIPEETDQPNRGRIAGIVWLAGSAAVAAWVVITSASFNYRLYKDRKLHRIIRGTKVYVSASTGVPCIAGFVPSIYITPEAANSKSEMLIIIHEHIHLRHGDHIWSIVRALAMIVFWWNPLVWIAASVSKQDAELACDDAIAAKLNDETRLKYAHILLDTIPQKHRYAVGFGSAPMKERILMLTKKQKNRWICLVLAIALALSAVGCSFVHLTDNPDDAVVDSRIGIVTENLSDILNEEQIALYEKAGKIYPLFNGISDNINILRLLLEGASFEEQQAYRVAHQTGSEGMHKIDGITYLPSYGEYDTFDEFKVLCLSVFSEVYFEALNQGSTYQTFINHNNKLYYIDAAKGGNFGYAPDEFPDKYELVEMSDEAIVFKVIGHYKSSNVNPDFTLTEEAFTVKMVLTENGWRFSKFAYAGIDEPTATEGYEFANTPTLSIPHDSLLAEMERIEENELFPAEKYSINVTGMSVPVTLYMQLDSVAAIEAHGHYVEVKELFDMYGNCSFELFEFGDAVIIEGGYYEIGDVYIISPERCSEMHPGTGSSYWLYLDDNGSLKYLHKHNDIASIIQTGALSSAVAYDEFLYASGDASIKNGEVVFAEPDESYTMSDRYDLDKEFRDWYSGEYSSIEEKFAENLSARNVQQGFSTYSIIPRNTNGSIVSLTLPAAWQWDGTNFNEPNVRIGVYSDQKRVTLYGALPTLQEFEDTLRNSTGRVYQMSSPITGKTNAGYSYTGYYGDEEMPKGEMSRRYLFYISTDRGAYELEVWQRLDFDGENFFEDTVQPIVYSFAIQQTLPHQAIMDNQSVLYDTSAKQEMLLGDWLKKTEYSISKYSVIDLNGDSESETVLWLTRGANEYVGFLILHSEQDTVYAYEMPYRAFKELKEDGTFGFSSGISDHGIGIIDFADGTYTVNKIAYCESGVDQQVTYSIENRNVTKEEFDAYVAAQNQKQNAVWQEYEAGNKIFTSL